MKDKKTHTQPRDQIFDLLRIILTVLVVNVHIRIITGVKSNILEPLTWYTVPLFIILSFFFFGSKSLILRIKRLFLPFIFWSMIGFTIHPNLISSHNLLLQLLTGHVVNTPLYYLVLLALFTIIYWLINRLPNNFIILVYTLIISIALLLEYSSINFNFFSPMITIVEKSYGRFVELIKFVPVGLSFGILNKKISNKNIFLYLSLAFFIIFFAVYKIPVASDFHFSGIKTLAGSISIFSFVLWLSNLKINFKLNRFISAFGEYSFGVYLLHYLLLEALLKIFPAIKSFIVFNQFLFLFCFVIFCYLFCFLFDFITLKRFSFLIK